MLSTRGRYGLRLLTHLAGHWGSGPVSVEHLSSSQGISGHYIHLLLGSLKRSGLVHSVRGRDGGYELSRHPSLITAYEVVSALEGTRGQLVDCVGDSSCCSRSSGCPTRQLWGKLAKSFEEILSATTLSDLGAEPESEPELNLEPPK